MRMNLGHRPWMLATCLLWFGSIVAQSWLYGGAYAGEIKVGNIMPYSGPASAYASAGKTEAAYFKMINDQGGINGRAIAFISYDDAYSPAKAVEQTRKLVENDEVLLMFNALGTPSNSAVQKYLNSRGIPQLFVASGATKFGNPKQFPWTMGWQPSYQSEGRVYAQFLEKNHPGAKIGILFQNDDFGRDLLKGFKDGLGSNVGLIVGEEAYDVSEPTVDSQVVRLKASGADVLLNITTAKFAAQSLKKAAELGWRPVQIVDYISSSVRGVIRPAGIDLAQGIFTASYSKDPTDPQWREDDGTKRFKAFLKAYYPEANEADSLVVYGYNVAQTLVRVLLQCGDDLSRANVMRQAANLKEFSPDMVMPGVALKTAADDYFPVEQFRMMRFEGERWKMLDELIEAKTQVE